MKEKSFKAPLTKTKENPGEMYFRWYLEELQEKGFIKRFDRELETIRVLPNYTYKKEKHLKSKKNTSETFNLIQGLTYTYDFRVIWDEKSLYIFTEVFQKSGTFRFNTPFFISHIIEIDGVEEIVSYIDVKPHFTSAAFGGGKNASYYTFPLIQKYLLFMKGLYINKVIPTNTGKHGINTCLFAKTFVPNRYLYTDAAQQLRTIKFKKTSLNYFVKQRKSIIDSLLLDIKKKEAREDNQIKLL